MEGMNENMNDELFESPLAIVLVCLASLVFIIISAERKSRVCIQWIPSHVGVFGNEVADLLAKEGSALPSAASGELFASERSSIHRDKKQILLGKSIPHTNRMLEIVLVYLYSPKVQDPHSLHCPDIVVAISKA
ncbi:hypothetical protein AVEN_82496-1 [Araneus ventricosus]|uniref:RNase H type-1 domain-containing protein n=1 Tax=Araneus ventricosus TaxID=182803 RepID=A0A4Y2Q4E4_ARAVE|nr:hypothetical protein AVEN_82496-1 [Araneus ventricosus]